MAIASDTPALENEVEAHREGAARNGNCKLVQSGTDILVLSLESCRDGLATANLHRNDTEAHFEKQAKYTQHSANSAAYLLILEVFLG